MSNLTKAETHNRMLNNTFDTYPRQQAVKRLKISRDEARTNYGKFTHGQWKELLQLF